MSKVDLYDESPVMKRGADGKMGVEKTKKPEGKGESATSGLSLHEGHAHARRAMHHRHIKEHMDMHHEHEMAHAHHKGDKKMLHEKHEREYGDMHGRHHAEMKKLHDSHEKDVMNGYKEESQGGAEITKIRDGERA